LQNIFLGLVCEVENTTLLDNLKKAKDEEDVDGKSLSEDEDVDGIPLDGAALLKRGKQVVYICIPNVSSRPRWGKGIFEPL
jgi:hypothetical protein